MNTRKYDILAIHFSPPVPNPPAYWGLWFKDCDCNYPNRNSLDPLKSHCSPRGPAKWRATTFPSCIIDHCLRNRTACATCHAYSILFLTSCFNEFPSHISCLTHSHVTVLLYLVIFLTCSFSFSMFLFL